MGCTTSKNPVHAYYDAEGGLVTYEWPKKHNPKRELVFVSTYDAKKFHAQEYCYVISSAWHAYWIEYATRASTQVPPEISNHNLLDGDGRIRLDLKHRKHFRAINKIVWDYYFKLYGGGPVICFKVPVGYLPEEYEKSTWIKHVRLHTVALVIHPSSFPAPTKEFAMVSNPLADAQMNVASGHLMNDLSKSKMRQAKEKDKEINATNVEAIGAMMAKDMAKKKLEEAQEKEKEQHAANTGAIGHMFAGELANQQLAKAKEAQAAEQQATTESTAMLLAKGNVKKNFKEALTRKDMKAAQYYAATMLKNSWRGKKARERSRKMRAEKQRLLEEGMARKLQSKYRSRLALRRVQKLKAEKQRMREEACAVIVQSNWRIRQARRKVLRLKAEKQRLLEEGAALKVQGRWRVRQATKRLAGLREVRAATERRMENAKLRLLRLLLLWRARFHLRKRRMAMKHLAFITVLRARGINIGDVTSSDPYVLVSVDSGHFPNSSSTSASLGASVSTGGRTMSSSASSFSLLKAGGGGNAGENPNHVPLGPTRSKFKTTAKSATLTPEWNETAMAVNVTGDDRIVLTLMDKDSFHKDKFLGQIIFDISQYSSKLFRGETVTLKNVPIDGYKIHLYDLEGKLLSLPMSEIPGKGTMDFTVALSWPRSRCYTGWAMKMASQLISLSAPTFKARFFMIYQNKISYFDNEHTLDHPRDTMQCRDITRIDYGPDNKGQLTLHLTASNTTTGQNEWFFHWMENEQDGNIVTCLRLLETLCPQAPINGEGIFTTQNSVNRSPHALRDNSISSTTSSTVSPINLRTKSSNALRRGSAFFTGSK
jgi:hypothetical protein